VGAGACNSGARNSAAQLGAQFSERGWPPLSQFDARIKAADAAKKKLEKKANPVGEASVFVSHSWGSPFASLVGALEDYLKSHQQPAYAVYFWVDCFSINQHAAAVSTLDSAHWSRLFGEAIRSMGAVCLVATPWESPTALGRCWCLFELMSALSGGDGGDGGDDGGASPPPRRMLTNTPGGGAAHGVELTLGMPARERAAFRSAVESPGGLQRIADVYAAVDMQQASASVEADRQMIFGLVSSGVGFDKLNAKIRGHLLGKLLSHAAAGGVDEAVASLLDRGASAVVRSHLVHPPLRPGGAQGARSAGLAAKAAGGRPAPSVGAAARKPTHAVYPEGDTCADALSHAARAGRASVATLLLHQPAVRAGVDGADGHGARPLHFACARGDLALIGALLDAGASIAVGDAQGRLPLALLPPSCDASVAQLLAALDRLPEPVRAEAAKAAAAAPAAAPAAAKPASAPKAPTPLPAPPRSAVGAAPKAAAKAAPRLAERLLPLLARAAVADGLRMGNKCSERPGERYAITFYCHAVNGADLAPYVSMVTQSLLGGSPHENNGKLVERVVEMRGAPFERSVVMWGYYDTTLTVHWRPAARLGPPLPVKHTIVLRDPSLADDEPQVGEYDAGALVRVAPPALEKAASPAGGKARAASPRRAASPGRAPPASKSATTPGQRKPSPKRTPVGRKHT